MGRTAEQLQHAGRIRAAIEAYSKRIAQGEADWHDYHQRGVLQTKRAHIVWFKMALAPRLTARFEKRAKTYLQAALADFAEATKRVAPEDIIHKCAITCDRVWAQRLNQLMDPNPPQATTQELEAAIESLQPIRSTLAAKHQLAIAYHFLWRVTGEVKWLTDAVTRCQYNNHTFQTAQFYRSLLCQGAVRFHNRGSQGDAREYLRMAIASAKRHNDRGDRIRAYAIWQFGAYGDMILQILRDPFA